MGIVKHAPRGPIKAIMTRVGGDDLMDAAHLMDGKRCKATSKQSGQRCKRSPIRGGTVCKIHGGGAPQVIASAQERLKALQPKALTTMDTLMGREEYPTVQFAAAKAVIDWTEGRAAERVAVTHSGGIAISHEMPE